VKMASNDEDLCTSHADFAVVCSFIDKFGEKLGLTLPNIGELQSSLEDTDNVSPLVSQSVSQLLRRINKSVKLDRWEKGLQRFAHSYSHQDGWELERFGFKKAKLEVKIRVLKNLLEAQFDLYKSFKDKVNLLGANELRLQPCGRDKKGVSYWCQLDDCANLRVYSDDQDEETWTLVASSREELVALIAELDSESPLGASREMSVDGSHSGTATPVGLSEAPTPVDSKAPTPVASGRTSPVIDTGQDGEKKDEMEESKELEAKVEVEKVKEKLEDGIELQKVEKINNEKLDVGGKVKDNLEVNEKVNESLEITKYARERLNVSEKVKENMKTDIKYKEKDEVKQRTDGGQSTKGISKEEQLEKVKVEAEVKENVNLVQKPQECKESKIDVKANTNENLEKQEKISVRGEGSEKPSKKITEKMAGNEKENAKIEENKKNSAHEEEISRKLKENQKSKSEEKDQISVKVDEKSDSFRKISKNLKVTDKVDESKNSSLKDDKEKSSFSVEKREGLSVSAEEREKNTPVVVEKEKNTHVVAEKEKITPVVAEKEKITPVVAEKGKTTPVVAEKKKNTSVVAEKGKTTPVVAEKKKNTPVVTEKEKKTPVVTEKEKKTPVVTEKEKNVSVVAEKKKITPVVAVKEKITPVVAEKEKITPVVAEKEKTMPVVAEKEKITPVVPEKEKITPVVPEKEKITPVVPEKERITPVVAEKEKTIPVVAEKEKITPVVAEKEKTIPVVAEKEKITPVVAEKKKMTPVVTEKEKTPPVAVEKDKTLRTVVEREKNTDKLKYRATTSENADREQTTVATGDEIEKSKIQVEERALIGLKVGKREKIDARIEEREKILIKVDREKVAVKLEEEKSGTKVGEMVSVGEAKTDKYKEQEKSEAEDREKYAGKVEKNGERSSEVGEKEKIVESRSDGERTLNKVDDHESAKLEVVGKQPEKFPSKGCEGYFAAQVEKKDVAGKNSHPSGQEPFRKQENVKKDTVGIPQSIDTKQEPVVVDIQPDDTTKAICEDIAAKKDLALKERISAQDVHEVKDRFKLGILDKVEVRKKESVWDKLNKMKEKGEASALEKESIHKEREKRKSEVDKKDFEVHKKLSKEIYSEPKHIISTKVGHKTVEFSAEPGKVVRKDEKENTNKDLDEKLHQRGDKTSQAMLISQPNLNAGKSACKVSDFTQNAHEVNEGKSELVTGIESQTVQEPAGDGSKSTSFSSVASSSADPIIKPQSSSSKVPFCGTVPSVDDADTAEPPFKKLRIMNVKSESHSECKDHVSILHQKQDVELTKSIEKSSELQMKFGETSGNKLNDDAKVSEFVKMGCGSSSIGIDKMQKKMDVEIETQDNKMLHPRPVSDLVKVETKIQTLPVSDSNLKGKPQSISGKPMSIEKVAIAEDLSCKGSASVFTKNEAQDTINVSKQTILTDQLKDAENKLTCSEEKMEVAFSISKESDSSKVPIKEEAKESLSDPSKKDVEKKTIPDSNVLRISEIISNTPVQCLPKNVEIDSNINEDVKNPGVKNASQLKNEETSKTSDRDCPKSSKTEQEVGEAIEEPVMLVKGDGEGAQCEAGNPIYERTLYERNYDAFSFQSRRPWWECFQENDNTRKNQVEEAVVEDVMYFWGEGNGVDCDAGNNGDETDTNTETKQAEGGGSGTSFTADKQVNPASSDCKPQKEVENIRTEGDPKEVDGVSESDEAKVNGLRTRESVDKSDKSQSWQGKPECPSDIIHSSVNGKKVSEENNMCNDTDESKLLEKDNEVLECRRKRRDLRGKGNKEKEKILNNTEFKGKEGKVEVTDSENKPLSDKIELRKKKKDPENIEVATKEKLIKVKKGRDNSRTISTRNRTESDRKEKESEGNKNDKEKNEESSKEEEDEDEEDDEDEKELEELSTRSGRRRALSQKRGTGKRRKRPQKRSAEQLPGTDGEEENEIDHDDGVGEADKKTAPLPSKKRRQRGKGSTARPLPDVPRQRSARIAKIREKEEQERRNLEAMRLKQLAEENRLRELKKKAREERRSQREIKKGRRERKEKKERDRRKKKRKKRGKRKRSNPNDPWAHSSTSSSSSSEEDEEEDLEEDDEEENLVFKSDHEFSPESDIEEADAQPIKRARTAKKVTTESEVEDEDDEQEEEEDQTQCTKCGHDDHPETILLCDNCDAGWHLSCLRPPLLSVPEGDWVCPTCEHIQLVNKLRALLHEFDECQKRAHNEELRRQRLAYVNVSLSNVLPDGKKKKKRRHHDGEEDEDDDESGSESDTEDSDSESDDSSGSSSQSSSDSSAPLYTLRARSSRTLKEQVEDFDEMINEAIRDEMEAAAGAGNAGRGKDIDNIIQANDEEICDNEEKEEEEEEEEEVEEGLEQEKKLEPEQKHDPENIHHQENKHQQQENKLQQEATANEEKKHEQEQETNESAESKTEVEKEETKKEDVEGKREWEGDDDDDEEVAPKRKKPKPADEVTKGGDDDYKESDEMEGESESDDDVKLSRKRERKVVTVTIKKRRRLTDLDAEDDDDASDEDFMNTSEEDEEDSEESAESSSSIDTEMDSDDSDVVGVKRRRSSRWESLPLRRSARNRRGGQDDDDSEMEERCSKKQKNKKKKRRRQSSSEEEEEISSDSDRSYKKKKKVSRKKKPPSRSKGKKGSKSKSGKKQTKSKQKSKKGSGEDEEKEKKPSKPRIKYSKPPKPKGEEQEEEVTQRRVTRGRQVNYYDALLMSDETEEEEPAKKWRGKVMKGERVPTESSEYEASDDERMKRRGVSGGLGRGKVMKGEEEDEENKLGREKKKRGRPKKSDELTGKPSPPSTIKTTNPTSVSPLPSVPTTSSESTVPVTQVVTSVPV
ncbi:hypothetical protein OTU49_002613, partial [Cherax quadricarinatus]